MSLSPISRALLCATTGLASFAGAVPLLANDAAALSATSLAAQPQSAAVPQDDEDELATASADAVSTGDDAGEPASSGEIVVSGRSMRGQLIVDQAPLLELDENAIAAEGVTSITDLIAQISARTGSARGRGGGGQPIILVNGIRIGSFREFANYPPEALARVEVFPEEVAQRFGFAPDRRVINMILKDNYSNRQIDVEFEAPSRGGYTRNEEQLAILKIADGGRINASVEVQDTTLLTEAERGVPQTEGSQSDIAGDPDPADFRSLLADTFNLEANVAWAKAIIDSGTSLSANLNYVRAESRSLDGLNTVVLTDDPAEEGVVRTFGEDTPLARRVARDTFSAAGSLTRPLNAFRLSSTFDGSLSETETEIDRRLTDDQLAVFEEAALAGTLAVDGPLPANTDNGFDVASSRTITGTWLTTLEGPIGALPAGEVLATFDVGLDWQQIESADTRSAADVTLTRRELSTGANVVIPLTSARAGVADALGSFTLNLQAGAQDLSDFGVLGDWNAGLTWSPFDGLDLSATYIWREVAPELTALGNPQIVNFNVPVFDFVNGETVLAEVTTGGNPDLPAETQRDWKFSANWELPFWDGSRISVDYIRNRSDNVVSAFPQVTAETEAAFPDRITRDADGTLIALDRRPVSFAETRANRLQFTFSTNGNIGGGSGGPGGGGPGGRFGGMGGGGGGGSAPAPATPAAPTPAPPTTGPLPVAPAGAPRAGGGFAPSAEQRAQFMAVRERLCGPDGTTVIAELIARIERGENVADALPGIDPTLMTLALDRARGPDGTISPEGIARLQQQFCSFTPPPSPSASGGAPGGGAPGGGAPAAGAPGGGAPAFNPLAQRNFQGFRYFLNLTHTIELDNTILIAPGLEPLDQLDGEATSAFGLPRHSSRLEAGLFGKGMGLRLSGIYTGETRLDGTDGSSDLFFDDIVTFNLRIFANLGQVTGKDEGVFKDLRIGVNADNVFDAQRRVVDSNGETPVNYHPFVIDPLGLYLGIDVRKLF